jgi:phosphopantothenoylcysteine synthetase/decarboxylase
MSEPATPTRGVLYVVTCAAGPARDVHVLVELAQREGWDVCGIVTPYARDFVDVAKLEALTGHPVRSEYKKPWEPDVLPPPDAIIVAPASFNTINKWAAGISDTLALGLVTEAIGKGLPLVAIPAINAAQAKHPAFTISVEVLRRSGVSVLFGEDIYEVHEPGMGANYLHLFPWKLALTTVTEIKQQLDAPQQ